MRKFFVCQGYDEKEVELPKRATAASAGYDFRTLEGAIIPAQKSRLFHTGVKACMEKDDVLLIFPRSSLATKRSLRLTNSVAVIDSDYFGNEKNDGEIMISLFNFSDHDVSVEKGERIAQGIFMHYEVTDDDLAEGKRVGGYGSTGRK